MTKIPSNNHFDTSDTAQAAYLFSLGYELVKINNSQFPSIFIFNQGEGLEDAARAFQSGTAEGNIFLFFRAYKRLLGQVKNQQEVEG